jgi:hypothetical protein
MVGQGASQFSKTYTDQKARIFVITDNQVAKQKPRDQAYGEGSQTDLLKEKDQVRKTFDDG